MAGWCNCCLCLGIRRNKDHLDINAHGFLQMDTLSYFTRGLPRGKWSTISINKKKMEVVNNVPLTYSISTVFVANVGDAKAVVARSSTVDGLQNQSDGESQLKAIVLTREHKAIYPQERARIQKAGGAVSSNGRLQGRLEVSRAFGDRQFKKVGVVATPEIHSFDLTNREHFIILGCDGLWGVFGPSDAVDFVHKLLKEGLPVTTVSRRLVKEAVRERRCKDNCTAIVIAFRHK